MATFHRKQYRKIAKIVSRISSLQDRLDTFLRMTLMFQEDNPAFDKEKFREACCVPEIKIKEVRYAKR